MSLPRVRAPRALIALLLWPGLLLAQRTDPGPLSDARRGIDRGNAEYIAAFARVDADGVATVYDADGVRLGRVGGKYVATWVRQADGAWKIKSDLAVPGT